MSTLNQSVDEEADQDSSNAAQNRAVPSGQPIKDRLVSGCPSARATSIASRIIDYLQDDDRLQTTAGDVVALGRIIDAASQLPSAWQGVGLNLLHQLVGGGNNALRDLDVFACNDGEHEAGCECFWEQCETWALPAAPQAEQGD